MTDRDDFPFADLKFIQGGNLPFVPSAQIEVYLPDRTLADIKVVWKVSISDTLVTAGGEIQLLHGDILITDKSNRLIFNMGEFAGTKTTGITLKVGYEFSDPRGPSIHFSDGSALGTIGDGIWPDLIVM